MTAPDPPMVATAAEAPADAHSEIGADDAFVDDEVSIDGAGHEHVPKIESWVSLAIVGACAVFVFWKLHPSLIFRDTTANGGDMGAHVWFPAYLRDHVLGKWQITGWSPDWYAGFPVGQFYFPIPALLVVLFDLLLPYNVAFKLVTALAPAALPIAAYVFGRGLKAPRPTPVLFALAAVVMLFFKGTQDPALAGTVAFNQHVMGGTLAANLAGEYSFTIALVFALLFLGTFAYALRERRRFALTAFFLAMAVMSHVVIAFFVAVGALAIMAVSKPLRSLRYAIAIAVVAALLSAVWTVPFVARLGFTTQMRYEKITDYATYLHPDYLNTALALALIGVGFGFSCLRRSTAVVLILAVAFWVWFERWPVGHVWNLRFLPFWYLSVFLLAACGVSELIRLLAGSLRWATTRVRERHVTAIDRTAAWFVTVAMVVSAVVCLSVVDANNDKEDGFLDYWAQWNYSGYESKPGYPEFASVNETMARLPPGRAFWERATDQAGGDTLDAYGGDFALMLLPYFTRGRIGSFEGLYYDGSASTPYYFLTAAHLSRNPASTVRIPQDWGVRYAAALTDFDLGIRQLQAFGVRYYMAQSPEAKKLAAANPRLSLVSEIPDLDRDEPKGWQVYEVEDANLVAPLTNEPVVYDGSTRGDKWTRMADAWWEQPATLDQPIVAAGPKNWRRIAPRTRTAGTTETTNTSGEAAARATVVDDAAQLAVRPLKRASVTNIDQRDDSISFDVSRTGVPIVVKTSYYPNWSVKGADGPYRATPNVMVVVPTSRHVELVYKQERLDWLGLLLSAFGLVGLLGLALWRPLTGGSAARWRRAVPGRPSTMARLPARRERSVRVATVTPDAKLDTIFKAYDIRGLYPSEIDEDVARKVGNAFVGFTGASTLVVGRDMRPSSVPLAAAFIEGATRAGADVIDVGLASTDLVYFASGSLDVPGAMFTASHNPGGYNGIKLCRAGAGPIGADTGLTQIKAAVADGLLERSEVAGQVEVRDLLDAFAAHVRSFVDIDVLEKLRVVADTANGMGGLVVPRVFDGLPFDLSILFGELDGTFPNHPADPIQVENLEDLRRAVLESGADVGLAFDGDADRVFLVDDLGEPVSGSTTTAIVAKGILDRHAGETVVHNLICSKAVPEVVREAGGIPVRTRVGHSYIKQIMAETGAIFGGEHSAHYYFRDNYRADSGSIAALVVLEQLSRLGVKLSELRKPFERYAQSGEINTKVSDPLAVIEHVAGLFGDAKQDRLDGLTVDHGEWWFNLRASNTEPLLRLNLEAADEIACKAHTEHVLGLINAYSRDHQQ